MHVVICKTCSTTTEVVDPFPNSTTFDRDDFEIVKEFCYLGDVIEEAGGCTDTVTACIGSAWRAFHEVLPILTNKGISLVNCGRVFKPVSEVFFCMEVKPGPCLQKTCHKLKDVTMQ